MNSRFSMIGIVLSMSLALVGCSTGAATDTGSKAPPSPGTSESEVAANAEVEGKLVWYTGTPEAQAVRLLAAFQKKYPSIDVSEFFSSSAGKIEARLQAEAKAGKHTADVVNTGDVGTFIRLKADKKLAQYHAPDMDILPEWAKDDGYWATWRVTPVVLAYSSSQLKDEEAPTSWESLSDPKFEGRVGFQDSTSGIQQTQWNVLKDLYGDGYWQSVSDNKPVIVGGQPQMMQQLISGQILVSGMSPAYQVSSFARDKGAPVKTVFPKDGVPIAISPNAVLEDAPHPNAARLFQAWLISADGQNAMIDALGDYSPRPDGKTPPGLPAMDSIKTIQPDSWQNLAGTGKDFTSEWQRLIMAK